MLKSLFKDMLRSRAPAAQATSAPAAPAAPATDKLAYGRGGTIVAFLPYSEGEALRQITLDSLAPLAPSAKGIVTLEPNQPDFNQRFAEATSGPVWFAIGPFGVGESLFRPQGAPSLWAEAGVPFVRVYGDTPAYYPNAHIQHQANSINLYGSYEHWNFFLRCFPQRGPCLLQPGFPYGAIAPAQVDAARKAAGAIIFPKNGNPPDRLLEYWRDHLPADVARVLEAIAEQARAAPDAPLDWLDELDRHFAELGIALPRWHRLTFFLVSQLDDYLRRYKSNLVASSLLDYPIVVRGVNWSHVDFAGRRARHDPDSDYARTGSMIDECMALIDMSPNTHRGPHDRALRAAARYTAFLTNRQQFYAEKFANHADFTYRFNADEIRAAVERALSRPRETVELGFAQGARMRELRTPETYALELTTAVDACALACGPRPPGTQNFVHFNPLA
jgi:hypothetical protein